MVTHAYDQQLIYTDEAISSQELARGVRLFQAWRAFVVESDPISEAPNPTGHMPAEVIGFSKVAETISGLAFIKPQELIDVITVHHPKNLKQLNAALRQNAAANIQANNISENPQPSSFTDKVFRSDLPKDSREYLAALTGDNGEQDFTIDHTQGNIGIMEFYESPLSRADAIKAYEELAFAFIQPLIQKIIDQKVSVN